MEKVLYKKPQNYILELVNQRALILNILQVKRNSGIRMEANYNQSKSANIKISLYTSEKEK